MAIPAHPADSRGDLVVDCSVLVPVLNEERYLERTVAAMRRQRFPGTLEFVVSDGGSNDRTREILDALARQDPRIRVFENPRGTVSSGLNVALRRSRGRWIARMDAHTAYPDDYLARGVERLEQGGTRWVSGPPIPTGDGPVSRAVALALGSSLGRGGSRKWGTAVESPGGDSTEFELDTGVFGGVWARTTLLEYGGWDERWAPNEDSEMAGRFLAAGERLVCLPAMAAEYMPRDSLCGLWRQYRAYGVYRARTARRHPHTLRRSSLLPPALVLATALAACGPRRVRSAARAGLCGYAAALGSAALRPRQGVPRREALMVPVVLSVMHYAHGCGFIQGAARHGIPVAALASIARLDSLAAAWAPAPEPVFNPSLGAP